MNPRLTSRTLAALIIATMLAAAPATRATVLTFSKSNNSGPNGGQFAYPDPLFGPVSTNVYSDYGDNVTAADLISGQDVSAAHGDGTKYQYGATGGATPDITVTYIGPVSDSQISNNGMRAYQDANHPLGAFPVLVDPIVQRLFTFSSSHAWQVVGLRSLTLSTGGFPRNIDDLRVVALDGGGNQIGVLHSSGAFTTNAFLTTIDLSATLAFTQGAKFLAIDFDPATNQNNVIWDDITFAQVPEPGSFVAMSLVGLGLLRRRR